MNQDKLLIWDLDDTLIITNPEFEKTNEACAEIISNAVYGHRHMAPEIVKKQRVIDLEMVKKHGFVRPRYLYSWLETCEQVSKEHGVKVPGSVVTKIHETVEDIYVRKYENIPNSLEVLKQLKSEGYTMVVLTAGEQDVQRNRVAQAGVLPFVDEVHVYGYKTPETFKEVIAKYPDKIYHMIGNSLKSDIHPALENGAWGIHVIRDTWEADHYNIDQENPLYRSITSLAEIPTLLREIHQSVA